jgi:predicted CopG family antitoxin
MAFKTITVKESSYRTIARCKLPGESFSDVIDRELGGRILTVGDLLAHAKECRATSRPLFGSRLKSKGRARRVA